MSYTYDYPRPAVTVDAAVLTVGSDGPEVLLIKRGRPPFTGDFALPGGFLEMDEQPVIGALRELSEETGITGLELTPLFACGQVGRDPRSRNITMVFGAFIPKDRVNPKGGDDADEAAWFNLRQPPKMAFDHATVLREILCNLRWQAATSLLGRQYFQPDFDADSLQALHAKILGNVVTENPAETLIERGRRLGLIEPAGAAGRHRFKAMPKDQPDYLPLIW